MIRGMDEYEQNAGEWRTAAESTFSGAMELFRSNNFFVWFPAATLAHHALEQVLKSALIRVGYTIAKGRPQDGYAWGHELVKLAQLLASKRQDFPLEILKDLAVFDAFFDELRYPQASALARICPVLLAKSDPPRGPREGAFGARQRCVLARAKCYCGLGTAAPGG